MFELTQSTPHAPNEDLIPQGFYPTDNTTVIDRASISVPIDDHVSDLGRTDLLTVISAKQIVNGDVRVNNAHVRAATRKYKPMAIVSTCRSIRAEPLLEITDMSAHEEKLTLEEEKK